MHSADGKTACLTFTTVGNSQRVIQKAYILNGSNVSNFCHTSTCCHFLLCSTVVFLVHPLRGDEKLSKKYCDTNNILIDLQLILNRKIAKDLSLEAEEDKERKNYKGTINITYVKQCMRVLF
jgi:hypothetical protein